MPTKPDEFLDFPIHIVPQDAGKYRVDIRLAGGGEFYGTFAADDLLPWTSSGDPAQDGQRLFKTLFADAQLVKAWDIARERAPHRRIRLHIAPDAAELHSLPWELLRADEGWLATDDATPLSRFLPTNNAWVRPLTVYPIRVLVALSNPIDLVEKGLSPITVEWEKGAFDKIFAQRRREKYVYLDYLEDNVTLANLDTALGAGYHVLHIIAHGEFSQKNNQTLLYLQDDEGYAQPVAAEKFTAILRQQRMRPHVVFLSVCYSAAWGTADVAVGLGPQLIAAGIPAVVAMQDTVDITTARDLASHFYHEWLKHGAVDRALNTARRNLDAAWRSDAVAPVLLMHLENAQILDLEEAKFKRFGEKFVEWIGLAALSDRLREWRDTASYRPDMRQLAGTLLDKLADAPTLEQVRRDVPWLLLLGVLVKYTVDVEVAISVSVPSILELLHRPRAERELPALPQPPAPQQASSASKPSPGRRVASRGDGWEPELVHIPAGKFLMGTTERQAAALRKQFGEEGWYKFGWETPQHTVYLPDYSIGKYPVTNAQYRAFVQATGHRAPGYWDDGQIPRGKENHSVMWLYRKDVVAYCNWLAEVTGKPYRLPTEAEWEKAARGTDGRAYPWGNNLLTESLCNFNGNVRYTTPVGAYSPLGDSPYGCADMAGNVWEWTSTRWGPKWEELLFRYPYRPDGREDMRLEDYHVVRGGSYWNSQEHVRCAARHRDSKYFDFGIIDGGVRVCMAATFSPTLDSDPSGL